MSVSVIRKIFISILFFTLLSPATRAAEEVSDLEVFQQIEQRSGRRLGVAVYDLETGLGSGFKADERFPTMSTFKFLLAAAALQRVDRGEEKLDRTITVTPDVVGGYAPMVKSRVGQAMTVAELARAAITHSDNAAAQLLMQALGGPQGLSAFLREIGDDVTLIEDTVQTSRTHTTTPATMLRDMQLILAGDTLSAPSRALLTDWMVDNTTGGRRIRAGVPEGWRTGDKTGSHEKSGVVNDIAILMQSGRKPVLVVAYVEGTTLPVPDRSPLLADVGRAVVRGLQ